MQRQKQMEETQNEATRVVSMARKQKMREKELKVRKHREKIALESELEAGRNAHLSERDVLNLEHLDSVKMINSLAKRAAAFQVREVQMENKKGREAREAEYDEMHRRNMDRDRRADLSQRAVQRQIDQEKRVEARLMLEEQIAERQRQQIRAEEAKAIEAQKILELYKSYDVEDQAKAERHREHVRANVIQVAKTNAKIQEMKVVAKQREMQEERIAARYLRKKAKEEDLKFKEEERLKKSKEARTAKLRALQEKAQDKNAEQDALRAKRAWENKELSARNREMMDRVKKKESMEHIHHVRQQQEAYKMQQVAADKLNDMRADMRANHEVALENKRRSKEEQEKREELTRYRAALNRQRDTNELARLREAAFESSDGKLQNKKILKEHIVVNKIREQTIQRLQREGVKDQYLVELQHMDPTKFQS